MAQWTGLSGFSLRILSLVKVKKALHRQRAGFDPQRASTLCHHFAVQTTISSGWGRAGAAGNPFSRVDKEPGPQLGAKQLPGERPRETAET
jgi:hypothetical protein